MASKYNISIDFGDWDKKELNWEELFQQYYRILKKGGTLIVFYDIWKSNELKETADLAKFNDSDKPKNNIEVSVRYGNRNFETFEYEIT